MFLGDPERLYTLLQGYKRNLAKGALRNGLVNGIEMIIHRAMRNL